MTKRLKPREIQRRKNVAKFQRDKKQNSEHKLHNGIARAESQLAEVKELAKVLRPFLTNGAIILGNSWDAVMEDQIATALDGVIRRPILDSETGVPLTDENGDVLYKFVEVEIKEQIAARKHLIDTFPKLIPEEARSMDVDPLVALAERLQSGGGGKMALQVEVEANEHEADDVIIEGVSRIIDDNNAAAVDLSSTNA